MAVGKGWHRGRHARSALNQDAGGVSLPVVLRIYQLKDDKPFATATYAQLLSGSEPRPIRRRCPIFEPIAAVIKRVSLLTGVRAFFG